LFEIIFGAKDTRRSKRAFTLLGFPCRLGFALGSKRAYNPKEVTHPTFLIKRLHLPNKKDTNIHALEK
jgi:hypothetical protein